MEAELEIYRSLIQSDEHLHKFLFSSGFGTFSYRFSCAKTDFNEASKLFMVITTNEGHGTSEFFVDVPVDNGDDGSVPAPTNSSSTGWGEPQPRRQIIKVELSKCLKSMILYCQFEHVLVVQYDRTRDYFIYGPSLQRMVDKIKEFHQANKSLDQHRKGGFGLRTFMEKVFAAYNEFSACELGQMVPLTLHYDEDKYKANFHPPIRNSLYEGGRMYDMFCVQAVSVNPSTRAVFLDLGIFLHNDTDKNSQYRLSTLDEFCSTFALTPKETVIHYFAKPNLKQTTVIGPLFYMGMDEPIESLITKCVGMPCVYLSKESAGQMNFGIKMEPVTGLLVKMDQEKQQMIEFRTAKDPSQIALTLYSDIRSGSNWHQKVRITTQDEMIRARMAEYDYSYGNNSSSSLAGSAKSRRAV